MKVVYVLNSTLSSGGATKAFHNMLNGLVSNGIEPLVVVPDGNDFCKTLESEGIKTLILNYRPATYPPFRSLKNIVLFLPKLLARIYVNGLAARRLCKEVKNFDADLIHTNVSVINIGMKAARKLGIPHVTHIREYGDKDFNMRLYPTRSCYLKNFTRKDSHTICITKDISKYYHLDNQLNSKVIYDGVLHKTDVIEEKNKENYFLFAGRLEEGKGIADLISAYGKMCCEKNGVFPLLIAGDTNDKNYLNSLHTLIWSMGYNYSDYDIKFLGNRTDILELMSKAAALIVPSRSEGFGFITAEAMFSGCLVIGKDVAGTKEQFDNGLQKTGSEIGLRYLDEAELIKRMCEVMDNGIESYFKMIDGAKQTVLSLYTAERQSENIMNFYKNIIEK